MRKIVGLLYCSVSCIFLQSVTAQRSYTETPLNEKYILGKEFFQGNNYPAALDALTSFRKENRNKTINEECDYMIAVAKFEQKDKDTRKYLDRFRIEYPTSAYANEVKFLLGSDYFFDCQYSPAIRYFEEVKPSFLNSTQENAYYYRTGLSYLKLDVYDKAKMYFERIPSTTGEYAAAGRYYLAYINYAQKNYAEAAPVFSQLASDKDFGASAQYYLCQIRFIEKAYNEVIEMGDKLLAEHPTVSFAPEVKRLIGESFFEKGNYTQAEPYLEAYIQACAGNKNTPLRSSTYKYGVTLYNNNKNADAIAQLSQVTSANDIVSQSAYLYLGQAYLKNNDKNNARMAFDAASRQEFDIQAQETALYNYALLLHENTFSPFNESVVVFEKFLNLFPTSRYADSVNKYLIEVYLTGNNYNAALQSIAKIKQPSPVILGAKQRLLFRLGTEAMANGETENAKERFTQAISLGNYDAESRAKSRFWRGECNYKSGNTDAAVNDFQGYINSGNTELLANARYTLGYIRFKQHNFSQAQNDFEEVVSGKNLPVNILSDSYNRLADCYFYNRNFAQATQLYRKAAEMNPAAGDYALFQEGFTEGLLHNYDGKITLLQQIENKYPNSDYIDDALYEIAVTRVLQKRDNEAIPVFNRIISQYPHAPTARKSGLQLGMLYFNNNNHNEAISAYKKVITDYPISEEAKTAANDLKTVYMDRNDIEGYANYIGTLNGIVTFKAGEKDSLTFIAAERSFLQPKTKNTGSVQLEKYLNGFPNGAFIAPAHYYLGIDAYENGENAKAIPHLQYLAERPDLTYAEDAISALADIKYADKQYAEALSLYETLEKKASGREKLVSARRGILLCSQLSGKKEEVIQVADKLLKDNNLTPEWRNEARYYRGMAQVEKKEYDKALTDLKELAKDTRHVYGAHAGYLVGQIAYDRGKLPEARTQTEAFINSGTPHQYWLARAFILMSDILAKENKAFQAKQYLQSLKNNYDAKDDISDMIESRLRKLSQK